MRRLNPTPPPLVAPIIKSRHTARAIIVNNKDILLVYTKRYNDFSLPGGGIDEGESVIDALKRELKEEIGAYDISIDAPFGVYEEYRADRKCSNTQWHIQSFYFHCSLNAPLQPPTPEEYEVHSGMEPTWIRIEDAIAHNEQTAKSEFAGLSLARELSVLRTLRKDILTNNIKGLQL
ncbi:MutT/nudix family protein [Pseudoalteromonas luteoviolacea B = ATCC 29581]|nr:MutT/nudix family protein [Pseudoalteromonas luteoviolacea B = ATCC 29581]